MNLFKISLHTNILFWIIVCSFLLRILFISYPQSYVFDEVYHGFTALEYARGNRLAWDPWATPPQGVAFEWTHPPLAKEIMALSLITFHTSDFWGWRIPSVLLGVINIYFVFLIAQKLFNKTSLSTLAAFFYSIDGLSFVQSRTGMNDTYLVFFALATLLLFLHKKYLFSAISFGLALSSKWAALYLSLPILYLALWQKSRRSIIFFCLIPLIVYVGTYIPYFFQHYNWTNFWALQQQMYIYHTHLKATHDYASAWWSWPLNLYPVWYYVNYGPNHTIGNIFASGNPIVFILGFMAILIGIFDAIFQKSKALILIIVCYFAFLLPWALSPRIMFLYHYTPSLPFMAIALAYQTDKINLPHSKKLYQAIIAASLIGFILIYPFLVGIPVTPPYLKLFFATNLTKNPF